jgi:hypothetical protein
MLSYLKDTNAVEVYDGANWVASDDPNAIQNTIVDAKGDLITATAADTPARLAVGNNGETLVADSAATTGLSYKEDYAAGKNKIINGDFNINQRAFTSTTSGAYGFDRWLSQVSGGTVTYSAQTFTLGTAPVAGYEGVNFARVETVSQSAASDRAQLIQRIESVRTLAGETATVSFWAKADSGTPKIAVEIDQQFGSGGSPSSAVRTLAGQITLSTSWARYSLTVAIPSISGKTLGTTKNNHLALNFWVSAGTDFNSRTNSLGVQNNTFDFWGMQIEAGSVATAFQTATGTLQGELALAQRYYWRRSATSPNSVFTPFASGATANATTHYMTVQYPVPMRTAPSSVEFLSVSLAVPGGTGYVPSAVTLANTAEQMTLLTVTTSSSVYTIGQATALNAGNTNNSYLGMSAEL